MTSDVTYVMPMYNCMGLLPGVDIALLGVYPYHQNFTSRPLHVHVHDLYMYTTTYENTERIFYVQLHLLFI